MEKTPLTPTTLLHVCRLAEGGMGRVDLAMRRAHGFRRLYAVKRLHLHLASDPDFRSMFLDEARIAGFLRHPNVVGTLDVGEDEHGPFLVMDYVDGLPLSNLVRLAMVAHEPLERMPVQIAVRIALDVARGLHAAHELTVDGRSLALVHRDLSPQNVLIGFDGMARIVDFGIAKALGRTTRTATGVVKGKLGYMAPEQLRMDDPDRRSDLYSLGVVLYEMLACARLHTGARGGARSETDVVADAPPDIGEVRADVPDALVQLLFELLAEKPDARPNHARDVATRLDGILAELVSSEGPAEVAEYVELVASSVQREQAMAIEEALGAADKAETARADRAARARSRAQKTTIAVAALVVVALGVAFATGLVPGVGEHARERDDTDTPTASNTNPNPNTATDTATATATDTDTDTDTDTHTDTDTAAATATATDTDTTDVPVPSSSRARALRRRNRHTRMARASEPTGAADDATGMNQLPDWVDFGQ